MRGEYFRLSGILGEELGAAVLLAFLRVDLSTGGSKFLKSKL